MALDKNAFTFKEQIMILNKFFLGLIILAIILFQGKGSSAQDITYAKEVIGKLCSDSMKGRGYVGSGDRTAAQFFAGEFEKAGLKKYSKTYFQSFTTPVNSFPGRCQFPLTENF